MAKTTSQQILKLERAQARAVNHGDLRGALQMFDRGFVSRGEGPSCRALCRPHNLAVFACASCAPDAVAEVRPFTLPRPVCIPQ